MHNEEMLLAKLRRLPEREREQLLGQIDRWIEQNTASPSADVERAISAVQSTWASVPLTPATLRWVAEDKELEYDPS